MISSTIPAPLLSVLTPLPFLDHTKLISNSGPLHLLLSVSGMLFLQILHGDQPIWSNHPPTLSCSLSWPSFYCLHRANCHWKSMLMFVYAGFCLSYSLLHTQACLIEE